MGADAKMPIRIFRIALACLCAAAGIAFFTRLFMPKYMGKVLEGAFIEEYYRERGKHDVLFLGDCEVYENISPVTLWQEYGISSYIRGSAQQLIPQSYYLLLDSLHYEKPAMVVLSVAAMQQAAQTNESYNRMTLDGMRWSRYKYAAIEATKLPDEHLIEYIFPLLRFHSRWSELSGEDFRYLFSRPSVTYGGYYLRADVRPLQEFPAERRLRDPRFSETCYSYLDRIREACEAEGIALVLFKAPSLYPVWHEEWEQQIKAYAESHDLSYLNTLADLDATGIDFQTDTYDGGLHMNVYGAEKLSHYLGPKLRECTALPDRREGVENASLRLLWERRAESYAEAKAEQEEEFRTLGYLQKFA